MPKPEECRFSKSHEWVFIEADAALVGISDHAQREITDVVFVDLPKPGRRVTAGEACAVIESVKAAFDIYAPVAGVVAAVNPDLASDPALVNESPYEKGWLMRLRVSGEAGAASLMDHAAYQEFLKSSAGAAH